MKSVHGLKQGRETNSIGEHPRRNTCVDYDRFGLREERDHTMDRYLGAEQLEEYERGSSCEQVALGEINRGSQTDAPS
jgi:hypothetical protein